ncbi:MAG: hypothetical protein LRY67_03300 [Gammaproteobacteria bacterium]|nr:hypothetical protein [Gammaproteobacteria bacterium]
MLWSIAFLLGIIALTEVVSRAWLGDLPNSTIMIIVASFSLIINASILKLFTPFRQGEAYLKATWIFTYTDIIVNSSVIFSGGFIVLTHSRYPDLCIGFLISLYVMTEGWKIWRNVNRH